jgi:hypothetical protein
MVKNAPAHSTGSSADPRLLSTIGGGRNDTATSPCDVCCYAESGRRQVVSLRLGPVLAAAVEIAVGLARGRMDAHVRIPRAARHALRAGDTFDAVRSDKIARACTPGLLRIGIADLHDDRALIGRQRTDERRRAIRSRQQDKQ